MCLLLSTALCGCRSRAYSDVYVENMAAEIRDLEDQLYEYDYEYRLLEQELATLRAQNAQLEGVYDNGGSHQPLEFQNPSGRSSGGAPDRSGDSSPNDTQPPRTNSILENPSTSGQDSPSVAPSSDGNLPNPREGQTPSGNEFDSEGLLPPNIEFGEPMPPPMPINGSNANNESGPSNALELNLSRVDIPMQLASQRSPVSEDQSQPGGRVVVPDLDSSENFATLSPAVEQPTDLRVVELAFHPTLSRAANFDDSTDDDGLYLVLQPKNAAGEVVPVAAQLAVLILDPSRPGREGHIGRRDYSMADVRSKMQAGGNRQGIHLTLPWNGPDPDADRVIVFVRYTFPDGRQVVGDKEFFVSSHGGLKTVWAPRGEGSALGSGGDNYSQGVIPAGFSSASARTGSQIPGENRVVRPAVGSSVGNTASQAPAPLRSQ